VIVLSGGSNVGGGGGNGQVKVSTYEYEGNTEKLVRTNFPSVYKGFSFPVWVEVCPSDECLHCVSFRWIRIYWHCTISRKVAGPIPDEVIGFFNVPNPSSRTMALVSTQPLTEMSTKNLPGANRLPPIKPDNLTAICEPIV
jgi:hypothetical protein